MDKNILLDKAFACLAGACIGDVMGGVTECWHYEAVREKYGVLDSLVPELGVHARALNRGLYTYTDDTALRNYVAAAIIKKGGRITAYDLADTWLERFDRSENTLIDIHINSKINGGVPPREAGEGARVCVTAALGIAPIGIVNACDPRSAAIDAFEVSCMNQWKYGREAPMAVAAAVAEAFKPEATLDSVIEASKECCGPLVREHIEKAISIAKKYDDGLKAIPEFYEKLLVPFHGSEKYIPQEFRGSSAELIKRFGTDRIVFTSAADPLELVPVALAFFYIEKGDPMKAMIAAVNFGRDCDGIAGFAACIGGALKGSGKIDRGMVETVNKANNMDLMEQAEGVTRAAINVMKEKEGSLKSLTKLL